MSCYPWSSHRWGPKVRRWDPELRGIIRVSTCQYCGKESFGASGRRREESVDRGRYVAKELMRKTSLEADPKKVQEWKNQSRRSLPAVNEKRQQKLRAKQFGTDGKREWVMSLPCGLTGQLGTPENPIDPAHVGKSRGAGGGPEMMFPLLRYPAHRDFDGLSEAAFERKYKKTKGWVREQACLLHEKWVAHDDF